MERLIKECTRNAALLWAGVYVKRVCLVVALSYKRTDE